MTEKIHIEIVCNSRQPLCQTECGANWSHPDVRARAKIDLRQRFGNYIRLDYINMSGSANQYSKETSYPLLIINGCIRLTGQFDMRQLMEIVETQLEVGASSR
jgi:hypothetical protein